MSVGQSGADILVAKEFLDSANSMSGLQQMSGVAKECCAAPDQA